MKVLTAFGQLILIAFMALLVWGAWYIYQKELHNEKTSLSVLVQDRPEADRLYKTSPLVNWVVVRRFTRVNAALFVLCLVSAILGVFVLGFLANVTGIGVIRRAGRLLILCCAFAGALYLSYNAFTYWRYFSRMKRDGTAMTVRIEDIDRQKAFRNDRDQATLFYVYQARVNFRGESRVIAAGSDDYEHTHAGDTMNVLYDAELDDMMSVNYKLLYWELIFPFIVWGIFFYCLKRKENVGR